MLSFLSQYEMFDWFSEELRLPAALLIILVTLLSCAAGAFRGAGGEASMTNARLRLALVGETRLPHVPPPS